MRRPPAGREKVPRGGSFLCSENHCRDYRVSARSQCEPDSATNHIGFRRARPVADADPD
jgi:formylglycine-generating enzyme required for sulfatase activity